MTFVVKQGDTVGFVHFFLCTGRCRHIAGIQIYKTSSTSLCFTTHVTGLLTYTQAPFSTLVLLKFTRDTEFQPICDHNRPHGLTVTYKCTLTNKMHTLTNIVCTRRSNQSINPGFLRALKQKDLIKPRVKAVTLQCTYILQ